MFTAPLRELADQSGFRRGQLAAALNVPPSRIAEYISGREPVTGDRRAALMRLLALGHPAAASERVLYVLALRDEREDRDQPPLAATNYLPDSDGRPCVFTDEATAQAATDLLDRFGLAAVHPIPAWPSYVDSIFSRRTGRPAWTRAYSDRTFTIDAGDHDSTRRKLTAFLAPLVRDLDVPLREVANS